MSYKVLEYFTDLQDGEHAYNVGDEYPRKGYSPSDKRIEELSTDKNVRHRPVIAVNEPVAIVADEKTAEVQENKPKKRKKREE